MESDGSSNPYRIRTNAGTQVNEAPRSRSAGCGWMFICLILATLLGLTWLGILGTAGAGIAMNGGTVNDFWEEHLIEDNPSDEAIVIIEVDGLISNIAIDPTGMTMVESIKNQLKMAADDDTVKGVILRIDSPGGEVLASDDIFREVQQFQELTEKPVVASMSGLAASGGYYVAAPCQWIVANELTITGSIGVILHSYNYRGLMNKVGIQPQVFKSGRFKDMLSGEKNPEEILPEAQAMVQAMIDETFQRFKAVVLEGRTFSQAQNNGSGQPLASDWETYADGRILSGKQAFELGFVDELGNMDSAIARMEQLVDTSDLDLIEYHQPFSLGNFLGIFGAAKDQKIKLDLGLDFPRLQAGRLYFLASNYIN